MHLHLQVQERERAITTATNYRFSSSDVDKIVAAKGRFARGPGGARKNFAVRKTELLKERDRAAEAGEQVAVAEVEASLAALEARAEQLEKGREGSLGLVQAINARNRAGNVARALENIRSEAGQEQEQDPFTRSTGAGVDLVLGWCWC